MRRWALVAVAFCAAAVLAPPAAAQPLTVPYLPQTEDLCGGAAAAMVMRYWGATDTYPDAFASLVDRSAGGIRTSVLVAELTRRGWTAVAGGGDAAEMTKELGRGRPVIALIEDRPGRFHYVVVIERTPDRVVLHDPARLPSREIAPAAFESAWEKSQRWMLILLPPAAPSSTAADRPVADDSGRDDAAPTACTPLVRDGVAKAGSDRASARRLLEQAAARCPSASDAWRELAGLDALDGRWNAATQHATRAVTLAPGDHFAWRILATARYVGHDDAGALEAWNRIGEPAVNLIDVQGLRHVRYDVIAAAIGVELKTMLTPAALARAERRVGDVPGVAAARVTFHPVENHQAQIDVSVLERDRAPAGLAAAIHAGLSAATDREVSAAFSSMTGGGDTAGATWRWWEHRPMAAAFYAAPGPRALGGGVWRLELRHETQTFGDAAFEETHTAAGLSVGNWLTDRTRVTGGVALERWHNRRRDVALSAGLERREWRNRLRLRADIMRAVGADGYATGTATAAIRSRATNQGTVLFASGGYALVTDASPASVWPGADTGHAREVLLRAHPLLDDGIITGAAFGRRLAFASVETQRWRSLRRLPVRIAPAAFVDLARANRGLATSDARTHVDGGAGVRLALPGAGVLRVDLAHGLRDGGFVLSAAWDRRWN